MIRCFEKIRDLIEASSNRDRLLPWFDNRLLYVITTTAISGYFNPDNPAPFSEKKKGHAAYLQQPIVKQALKTENLRGLSRQRRIVLFLDQAQAVPGTGCHGPCQKMAERAFIKILFDRACRENPGLTDYSTV